MAARVQARVKSNVRTFDPFKATFGVDTAGIVGTSRKKLAPGQYAFLQGAGLSEDVLKGMSRSAADKMIATVKRRTQQGLCTYKQLRTLSDYGVTDPNLSFQRAKLMLTYIQSKGWGRSGRIDPLVLDRIAHHKESA
jgi:hypothetical protein